MPRAGDSTPAALVLSGGTNLLKDQSECPFRALASRRLHVEALETPAPGLAATDRGTLVHDVLEKIWDELGDSATLRAKTDNQLRQLVENAADEVLAEQHALASAGLVPATRSWMVGIALAWLHFESESRAGDWKVVATEADSRVTLAGVELAPMRIDRIDELADGGLAVALVLSLWAMVLGGILASDHLAEPLEAGQSIEVTLESGQETGGGPCDEQPPEPEAG